MIKLSPQEKIIRLSHRHWVVITQKMTVIILLLLIPLVALLVLPHVSIPQYITSLFIYLLSLYMLCVALIAFSMWMDYYLDLWIVTTKRIIDIEHKGIFNREVSEFMLERVQDVTIQKPNFLALMLGYGDIEIHTAGEKTFSAQNLPRVDEMKDIIMKLRMESNGLK